jgi:hypothetical protein
MDLPRLVKKVIGKIIFQGGGKEKVHTLWDRWTCANRKEWSRGTMESSLLDCRWLKKWVWILILKLFEIPNASRQSGSSLHYLYIHIFLYTYFFSFFIFLSFYYSPWNLSCIVPTSSPMLRWLLIPKWRGDGIRQVPEIYFLERDIWNLQSWHHLAIFLEFTIHTQVIGCGEEVNTKIIWFYGWISGDICKISHARTHNAQIEKASKR